MSDEVAEVLANGREYIENHGWHQGSYVALTGTVCAVGGLVKGLGLYATSEGTHDPRVLEASLALARTIGIAHHDPEECGPDCDCVLMWVTTWNDTSETTMQEVLDAFARAEKIERNQGVDPDE